jgi:hypothetical protein
VGELGKGFGGRGASVRWVPRERKESDGGTSDLFNSTSAHGRDGEGGNHEGGGQAGTTERRGVAQGTRHASERARLGTRAAGLGCDRAAREQGKAKGRGKEREAANGWAS